jgi:hypothetical protein
MYENYYLDMIDTARRALRRRNDARRQIDEFDATQPPRPEHRGRDRDRMAGWSRDGADEGPETWPGLYV